MNVSPGYFLCIYPFGFITKKVVLCPFLYFECGSDTYEDSDGKNALLVHLGSELVLWCCPMERTRTARCLPQPRVMNLSLFFMVLWISSCITTVCAIRPGGAGTLKLSPEGLIERPDGAMIADYEVQCGEQQ